MTAADLHSILHRLGWLEIDAVTPIKTGGNNSVFRVEAEGKRFVLKRYFQDADDPRDRFASERAFYDFLGKAGIDRTPHPLAWNERERVGLFEFVAGERPAHATSELVREAITFFEELNAARSNPGADSLRAASEACYSVAQHLDRVGERIDRLRTIEPSGETENDAIRFVREQLSPRWLEVRRRIETANSLNFLTSELSLPERCVSPSDFGFHNTIRAADGRLRFMDFEYSGWDDPAKLICDFFCQPAVPVPLALIDEFVERVSPCFPGALPKKVALLFPVYQIKWCCILLNEFHPTGEKRRRFSNPATDVSQRKRAQLERAIEALGLLRI